MSADNIRVLEVQKRSEWVMWVGERDRGVCYRPLEGKEPNAFHRMMHRLFFGFQWVRQ